MRAHRAAGAAPGGRRHPRRAEAAALCAVALCGCGGDPSGGPPEITWGQDVCDVCGMIISDERFAAGLVVSAARDSPPTRLFDDLGCLLEYERVRPDDEPARSRWVRAFAQDRWLRAEEARYVHASGIHSPMAFGLAAFEGDDAAAPLLEEGGGRVLDFTSLRAEFARGSLRASSSGGP